MFIKTTSFNGDSVIPIETEMLARRRIFVEGEIGDEMANDFVKSMMYLSMQEEGEPIKLFINSPGGDIHAGLMMCEAVRNCPCTVDAYCTDKAYSMAAILFESVNGKRNMFNHSKLMLHQPAVLGLRRGTASEIKELSKQMDDKTRQLLAIVSEKSGINIKKLEKEILEDRYYSSDEAVSLNLADKIVTFSEV